MFQMIPGRQPKIRFCITDPALFTAMYIGMCILQPTQNGKQTGMFIQQNKKPQEVVKQIKLCCKDAYFYFCS